MNGLLGPTVPGLMRLTVPARQIPANRRPQRRHATLYQNSFLMKCLANEDIYMFENFITLMIFSIVKRVHVIYIMYLYDTS